MTIALSGLKVEVIGQGQVMGHATAVGTTWIVSNWYCCWKWHFLHFTRYSGDIFQVCWTGSQNTYIVFLHDSVYQKLFILVHFWRSYSKKKCSHFFWDTVYIWKQWIIAYTKCCWEAGFMYRHNKTELTKN